jgi:hypothetical protein
LEILLLPGIVDIDGMELVPRPGKEGVASGVTDVLRFQVMAAALFGNSQ